MGKGTAIRLRLAFLFQKVGRIRLCYDEVAKCDSVGKGAVVDSAFAFLNKKGGQTRMSSDEVGKKGNRPFGDCLFE